MELINEITLPFDENKKIDYHSLIKLIDLSYKNFNNKLLFFTPLQEGNNLSTNEKIDIIKFLDYSFIDSIIFFQLNDFSSNHKLIKELNDSKITTIFINPPNNSTYTQEGLFLLTKQIIKLMPNKKIFLVNSSLNNHVFYNFHTIKKIIKSFKNVVGIYEDSYDYSLISLLKKHFPDFIIYMNEKSLSKSLSLNVNGIISISSITFGKLYQEVFSEFEAGYINHSNVDYIKFINDILLFNNNSTLIKTYLKKLGYKSMNVRLPLIIDEKDEENLEFLLS